MSVEPENKVGELLDRCRETIERNLAALDAASQRAIALLHASLAPPKRSRGAKGKSKRAPKAEEYNDKLVSHLAWLTIRVAEVTTSLRQLEKHDRTMTRTPEQRHNLVIAYIKQLDPVSRTEIGELIGRLEQQRSVLQ